MAGSGGWKHGQYPENALPRLATSVERLSSGLRVNSAADDAAGLAIRELDARRCRHLPSGRAQRQRRHFHDSDGGRRAGRH